MHSAMLMLAAFCENPNMLQLVPLQAWDTSQQLQMKTEQKLLYKVISLLGRLGCLLLGSCLLLCRCRVAADSQPLHTIAQSLVDNFKHIQTLCQTVATSTAWYVSGMAILR